MDARQGYTGFLLSNSRTIAVLVSRATYEMFPRRGVARDCLPTNPRDVLRGTNSPASSSPHAEGRLPVATSLHQPRYFTPTHTLHPTLIRCRRMECCLLDMSCEAWRCGGRRGRRTGVVSAQMRLPFIGRGGAHRG